MEEPGGLQSMGSLRVGHDWATSLSLSLSQAYHKYVPPKNTTKESCKAFFPSTIKHKADDFWYSPKWLALRMVEGMDTVKFQELSWYAF